MAFQPDILITTPEGVALVAEARVILPDLERAEEDLKQYMIGMQCSVGMLITPDHMWLYRDSFTARSPQSIRRVGEFNPRPLWPEPPPLQEWSFETFVQRWLEDLPNQHAAEVPEALREALEEYVLPAVKSGDVRAAHPRYS